MLALAGLTPLAHATLLTSDNTPFPHSTSIVGAAWTSPRYGPPADQWGGAANFDGCAAGLNSSGAYGFNYRRLRLTLAAHAGQISRR